ncbi:MAG: AI-2E family transporter [Acidobacteria bacterium]|nr:MAG: AI-2E family transporter [Acidobacteriota bacterium]
MNETGPAPRGGPSILFIVAAAMLVIAGLKAAAPLLVPLVASLFLAVLALPLLAFFRRLGCAGPLAVALTMLAVIAVIAGALVLVGGSFTQFTNALPRYQRGLEQLFTEALEWLEAHGIEAEHVVSRDVIRPGAVLDMIGTTLRRVAVLLSNLTVVLVTTLFLLAEASYFPEKLAAALGPGSRAMQRVEKIRAEVQRYLAIKTLISAATGVLAGLWCAMLGVDFPLLWGLLAFLLNYIPTLGSILAGIPPILLALVQFGPGRALLVLAGYLAINVLLGNLIEPALMGRRLGLSALVVFFSLVFWGWVWGPLGMLLSVPLTMIVKIMLENTEEFRWIAVLLDARPPEPVPQPAPDADGAHADTRGIA